MSLAIDTRSFRTSSQHAVGQTSAIDGIFAGAIGAGLLALFFLGYDLITTEAFRTPSLVGQVLLAGIAPASAPAVDVAMVALFSPVHLAAFAIFGWATYALVARLGQRVSFVALAIGCSVELQLGVCAVSSVLAPGLVSAIGAGAVLVGNAIAGIGVAASLRAAQRGWDGMPHGLF